MRVATNFRTTISASISSSQTTVPLSSIVTTDGHTLTIADLDTTNYMILEPGAAKMEIISFTGISSNGDGSGTLTGVTRGLAFYGSSGASVAANQYAHQSGSTVILSNAHYLYDQLMDLDSAETVTGVKTFDSTIGRPKISSDVDTAVATELVSFGQLSRQAIAGAANASTTVKGLVELATQTEIDARTTTGGSGALLVPTPDTTRSTLLSDGVSAGGTATAYTITPTPAITAYTAFQTFVFKVTKTNTGALTLAVNGLSAIPIKKYKNLALEAGDLTTNALAAVIYDAGTNTFQLSSTSKPKMSTSSAEIYATSTTGTTGYIAAVALVTTLIAGLTLRIKPDTGGGHATLNVNSLGAKNIFKYKAGVVVAVETGDIIANQIATVVYDGTQFLLQNQLSSTPQQTNGTTTKNCADASTTQTIAHGLGRTPKWVRIRAISVINSTNATLATAEAVYNGTTQSSQSFYFNSGSAADNSFALNSQGNSGTQQTNGVITFDSTNISIAWTKNGTPSGTYTILWEAVA